VATNQHNTIQQSSNCNVTGGKGRVHTSVDNLPHVTLAGWCTPATCMVVHTV
jgi:hypothetical protein